MLEVDAYDFNIYDPGINGDDRRQEYIDHLLSVAIHKRDITLGPNDHIILLSTCFLDVTNGETYRSCQDYGYGSKEHLPYEKSKPFPYSVFDDSSLGRFLSSIPLWIWYIILFILLLLLIFLLIILYLILRRRREAKEEGQIPLLTKLPIKEKGTASLALFIFKARKEKEGNMKTSTSREAIKAILSLFLAFFCLFYSW